MRGRIGAGSLGGQEAFDSRPVRRIQALPGSDADLRVWPYSLGPVAQLLREGLDLSSGVTFLVGENGTGKSTLLEAFAGAAGLNLEGGSRNALHVTRETESPLSSQLHLVRSGGAPRSSYFLRAETMHGLYTYLERLPPGRGWQPRFHEMSHGESFLQVLASHFSRPGFYLLDEPESALSFSSCLAMLGVLDDLVHAGGQVVCATHSPLLTALPGATILQLSSGGYKAVNWDDLDLVDHWRRYLSDPLSYLRHVLD